ncbi:MAG: pyrroloquinoline quinone biosynthesis protein PqqB [Acidobacteriota bacterium]|nr:MAG: pyrroloquinoline quinone biosynthesis protein PqqB [Acidobacteriota bacterium]
MLAGSHSFVTARVLVIAAACGLALVGCGPAAPRLAPPVEPYVVVLGTAQDGGLPHLGCERECCRRAWREPGYRRLAASLLIADPSSGRRWLVDATPDIREQLERAREHPPTRRSEGPRPPLFDGVFLSHAHIGHYTGLVHVGREAYGADRLPVFASASLRRYLEHNGPWSLLVSAGHIQLVTLAEGQPVSLAPELELTPVSVPHRDEYSDTFGFIVRGPSRALLYVPDIDKWDRWERRLEDVLEEVDLALVDGTFFADGEVPGRAMSEIPHPFIEETLARLTALAPVERGKIVFTHLNHSNPAADAEGAAARRINAAGCRVAREGEILPL